MPILLNFILISTVTWLAIGAFGLKSGLMICAWVLVLIALLRTWKLLLPAALIIVCIWVMDTGSQWLGFFTTFIKGGL